MALPKLRDPDLLTTAEFARSLGVSRRLVTNWAKDGLLGEPVKYVGRIPLYHRDYLIELKRRMRP